MTIKRGIFIGDFHWGVHVNSSEFFKHHKDYCYNWLIPKLKEIAKEGDVIFLTGDFHDRNQVFKIEIFDESLRVMNALQHIAPCKGIIGNHDIYKKESNESNSVNAFNYLPNFELFTSTRLIEVGEGDKMLMMPWNHSPMDEMKVLSEFKGKAKYLLSHTHTQEMGYADETMYTDKEGNIISNSNKTFDQMFERVFNGHIHKYQDFGKSMLNIGSVYNMKYTDAGSVPHIVVKDFISGEEEHIENDYSPRFKTVDFDYFTGLTLEEASNFVKNCYIRVKVDKELAKSIPWENIHKLLDGYYEIDLDPYKKKKDRVGVIQVTEAELQNVDVKDKMEEYVSSEPIDSDKKEILLEKLLSLYDRAAAKAEEEEINI